MEALTHERARAERNNEPFSLCILDLDRFKTINDRYGHLAGDRVLMAFSERIRGTLRGMDLVDTLDRSRSFGRYGGEEFIVLLPGTPLAGALRCAERMRKVTEEEAFDEVFRVTVSAGVAEYRRGESIENTLRRADAALYEAKGRGRNLVVAEDHGAKEVYEMAVGDTTMTNIVVGPFGRQGA
jgi:diguanylate cyclase (GGDEF)-like protein